MAVIETHDLTKKYGKLVAVDHISFQVERGQVFGFLGPNGSGKTTTIGMLLGIITPTEGEVTLLGRSGRRGLHEARQRVGATLEYPNFYPYLTGRQNLDLVADVKGVRAPAVDQALELVGLFDRQKDQFKKYSLGMKQRLALASTVLGDPDLVVLDEPANGLDPEGMREIRDIILRLADQGKTIFLSSHMLWEVERTCSHVAIIKKGRIVAQASVEDFVQSAVVLGLRADDMERLQEAAGQFPGTAKVWREDDLVVTELESEAPAELNRFLAERGVHVSHLAPHRRSLEDAFIELTGEEGEGLAELLESDDRAVAVGGAS